MIEQFLHFLWHISASQALLNAAPVYMLDGQHASEQLLLLVFPYNPARCKFLAKLAARVCTLLLCGNIAMGMLLWCFRKARMQ
jgi:hypothetical protein